MLVVDASCLFEVVADTPRAGEIAARLATDVDQVAPHVIDVEVMGVIRAQHLRGRLDGTAALRQRSHGRFAQRLGIAARTNPRNAFRRRRRGVDFHARVTGPVMSFGSMLASA